ncbi:alcohol acetyltransferase [Stachybotrys elegans]|uniref:Alcohol acetyltransferase n=1 Tax=Stachybotrys elegans TaxID=80388 RepID=A0A8K0SQK7_9HYPO|nr:alcohol acetyltransferase [Stachybotrys elegans]
MDATQDGGRPVIRPLGPLESFISTHHLLQTAYRTILTGRYGIPSSSSLDAVKAELEKAIALTVLEHSMMQPGLADEDSKQPQWVRLPSLQLDSMVTWAVSDAASHEECLTTHLVRLHSQPFTQLETLPGWRITVLQCPDDAPAPFVDVIFNYNHANADGMSGKIFHSSLNRNLLLVSRAEPSVMSRLAETLSNHTLQLPKDSKLSPTQEELMKFPVSIPFVLGLGWKGLRPRFFVPGDYAKWAPMRETDDAHPNETTMQLVVTEAPTLQRLLASCRSHKTTITGLLHALIFISLCHRLSTQPGFNGGTTVNMRRFINAEDTAKYKPDSMMGNYVTLMGHAFDHSLTARARALQHDAKKEQLQDLVWEVAARVRGELEQKMQTGTRDDMMGLVGMMAGSGDFRSILKGELQKDREFSWEVSNMGTLDADAAPAPTGSDGAGGWQLERLVSSQSAVANGAAILVFPISVKGGVLCTTITAQKGVVDEQLTEGLAKDLEDWLADLVKE